MNSVFTYNRIGDDSIKLPDKEICDVCGKEPHIHPPKISGRMYPSAVRFRFVSYDCSECAKDILVCRFCIEWFHENSSSIDRFPTCLPCKRDKSLNQIGI